MGVAQLKTAEALAEHRGQCTLLANVLLMTQHMVELAESGDWDSVTAMEADRRALLRDCFCAAVPPAHSEIFAEALAAMLHLNEELMSLLDSAKANIAGRHAKQVETRRGIGHYLDIDSRGR